MPDLPFASSNGSPVVLVPHEIATAWLGIGDEGFYTQYLERSSKVRRTEYGGFSTMPLAGSKVLIFEGEIHTTWLKGPDGGTLIREGCSHTRARATKLVASVPAKAWKGFTKLTLSDGRFLVVDSAPRDQRPRRDRHLERARQSEGRRGYVSGRHRCAWWHRLRATATHRAAKSIAPAPVGHRMISPIL